MKIISWEKVINGGTPKLERIKNINPEPKDKERTKELDKNGIWRLKEMWYIIPTYQNIIPEIISWVKKIKTDILLLIKELKTMMRAIKFIWQIEEKATRPFLSLWVEAQNGANKRPPKKKKIKNTTRRLKNIKFIIRNIPHPPNFKSSPARIILPKEGASTWALGSQ